MTGKVLTLILLLSAVLAGGSIYYLQVYGYYEEIQPDNVEDVQLTALVSGRPEPILYEDFRAIDAKSSPLRYRACFETRMDQAMLRETYVKYDDPLPNVAPGWFDCFDAVAIGEALEEGVASAYLGTANIHYGFDRVVAIFPDGRGYVWHQINTCGETVFDGDPVPEGCPPPPDPAR